MFDFIKNTAGLKSEKIKEWKVVFRCPFGICDTLDLAVQKCLENDLPPNTMIMPIAMAITENDHEIFLP